jgi:ribosomal protein S6
MAKATDVLLPEAITRTETYEILGLFRSTGETEANPAAVLEQLIVQSGGTITHNDKLGRRRLAYPIDRQKDGFMASIIAKLPTQAVKPMKATLALNESVLRVNFIKLDKATEKAILNPRQRPEARTEGGRDGQRRDGGREGGGGFQRREGGGGFGGQQRDGGFQRRDGGGTFQRRDTQTIDAPVAQAPAAE